LKGAKPLFSYSNSLSLPDLDTADSSQSLQAHISASQHQSMQNFVESVLVLEVEKPSTDEDSFLYCDEETIANTSANSNELSPSKFSFTFSNSYSNYESQMLNALINYIKSSF
jgi:hypothetical protein